MGVFHGDDQRLNLIGSLCPQGRGCLNPVIHGGTQHAQFCGSVGSACFDPFSGSTEVSSLLVEMFLLTCCWFNVALATQKVLFYIY